MKHLINTLNKAFDHRVRLGVMAVLMANESVSFKMGRCCGVGRRGGWPWLWRYRW